MFENRKVTTFFVIFKLFSQKVLHRPAGRRTNPGCGSFFALSAVFLGGGSSHWAFFGAKVRFFY